ncbi:UNVERIFIED_CONTAM: hypothetical protein GTU68_026625 [Idotea baltica]|nr:hypothetical protein [Idotea baltica]
MLFNSFIFLHFLAFVLAVYWLLHKKVSWQNIFLLVTSYVFYGWWNWKFLSLIAISTVVDYFIGRQLEDKKDPKIRKRLVTLSVMVNLGILGVFKYFNFFASSFIEFLGMFGMSASPLTLNILLPVGISFYTFQTLSYSIDIYRGKLKSTRNFIDFALFVSFFPQLVAGPIERAVNLLPQIANPRKFNSSQWMAGVFLIVWGLFKKVVIADNMALIADEIFNNHGNYQGLELLVGVLAFTFQIYGDFSGYSDIARGVAKLLGFELMLNFKLPYFAVSPSDFWQRWHISLSSWLRDYLYIPLGGNRAGNFGTYRNLSLTMLLGGLWHGAAWNFVIWGAFHGFILVVYRLFDGGKDDREGSASFILMLPKVLLMFGFTMIGWLIFRAESVTQIIYFFKNAGLSIKASNLHYLTTVLYYTVPLMVFQAIQQYKKDLLFVIKLPMIAQVLFICFLIAMMLIVGVRESSEFIYFQF